mgnify:FL=1
MKRIPWVLLLITGLAGAGGGWWFTETVLKNDKPEAAKPTASVEDLLGKPRPDFSLGSTTGEILTADLFDGQVVLVNFWATWCKPCREEMPMLSDMYERLNEQGFTVLGVALDDVAQARDFIEELNIRYPNAVGGADVMAMGVAYGNRAGLLPYSVLIDRQGNLIWASLGELESEELEARVSELL